MKVHIDFPWGGVLDLERCPMTKERADQITGVIYAIIVAASLVRVFGFMAAA